MVPASQLVDAVARVSGVPAAKIMNRSRQKPVVKYRHAIMFVLAHKRKLPPGIIARSLNYERTSVSYGLRQFEELLRAGDHDAVRCYRTAIRCYVRLKQQQKRFNEGVRNALENIDRVQLCG